MSEKRRAEIEAKRAKLAELRKARADRQKADAERRLSDVRAISIESCFEADRATLIRCYFRLQDRVERVEMWTTS